MEFINKIEIKNFKSIRHQIIDGCKRINIFIGYPNVGKSNLLEAISLFCISSQTKFKELIRVKEEPTLFFNGFIENAVEITVNDLFQIYCAYINTELQIVEKYFVDSNRDNTRTLNETWFRNFNFNRSIEPQVKVPRANIKKYEFRKDNSSKTTQYSYLEMPFGENVFNIIQTNEKLYKEASTLLRDYGLELLYDTGSQSFTIFKRTQIGILTLPFELLSDTLQRLIFYKAAIASNRNTVLLFEEPEAHMFPPYIRKFTSDIVFEKSNQYFLTTHSPYVFDALSEEASEDLSVYLVYYNEGETRIKHMNQKDLEEIREYGVDLFYNLESYLKHGQVGNA